MTRRGGTLLVTGPSYLNMLGLYRVVLRLVGRRFTEMGQPINHPLILARQVRRIAASVARSRSSRAVLPIVIPKRGTFHVPARPQRIMRWFSHHAIVVATRH